MSRSEKRYFRLHNSVSGGNDNKIMMRLFDEINACRGKYDEKAVVEKVKGLKPEQVSNMKAYLYNRILQAMRQFNACRILDIQIREQIDYAQLLFERRLYAQGLNCLRKARKLAATHDNPEQQLEIIKLEKSVLMNTIDHDTEAKVDGLISEVRELMKKINNISMFSNLSIKLNSLYTRTGYIKDEEDYLKVKAFFENSLAQANQVSMGVTEYLHLYRLYAGYYFFVQDFENGYQYACKLASLYQKQQSLRVSDTEGYIKAINNLLIAQFKLNKYDEFVETNKILQSVADDKSLNINESTRIRLLKYYYMHEINRFFMDGNFSIGIEAILEDNNELLQLLDSLDHHSGLILSYKIACLYFGAGDFHKSLKWINRLINTPHDEVREDLHSFSRIIHLVCHYELGNRDLIRYYVISTYRYLLKKKNLQQFQRYILSFLKELTHEIEDNQLIEKFRLLKSRLLPLADNPYEKRAFIYFDIISWLESKIEKKTVEEIIAQKAKLRMRKC
ncbi:hypothetical protein RCC89_16345 [Cytophagaceae bacterium ABcell3]|nr:hypothetical protein RCC89_16345 [Cytophagaceae bacterium ABcell3]